MEAEDDIFASLGNSLMRDLLTDIAGPESSENDMFQTLASLEKELEDKVNVDVNYHQNAPATKAPPPGLVTPSAGARVVNHSQTTANAIYSTIPVDKRETTMGLGQSQQQQDAFSASLQQFSALSLAEDFLKADSARKQQKSNIVPSATVNVSATANSPKIMTNDVVDHLFEGEEEYDVKADILLNHKDGTGREMAQLFPGLATTSTAAIVSVTTNERNIQKSTNLKGNDSNIDEELTSPSGPPPPHLENTIRDPSTSTQSGNNGRGTMGMNSMHSPPPPTARMNAGPGVGPTPLPPQTRSAGPGIPPPGVMPIHQLPSHQHPMGRGHPMPPPPPIMMRPPLMSPPSGHGHSGIPPPHVQQMMMMQQIQMQQQMQMQQQQAQAKAKAVEQFQKQQEMLQVQASSVANTSAKSDGEQKKLFTKVDFPALGADARSMELDKMEEAKREKEEAKLSSEKLKLSSSSSLRKSRELPPSLPHIRIMFHNPSPTASTVPATAIKCTSMTSRDLCYVLHSMLRPVLSFASVTDAYNADYYRWSYDDRKSRNLLFLGRTAPVNMKHNLPNPVWKETKIKAKEMEEKFTESVEMRADKWSKEKHALGKIAKVNVKRPRALLSTTAMSRSGTAESKIDGTESGGSYGNGNGLSDHETTEGDRQRAILWAARVAIDKGYQAYLNLVELRRLLQSRPSDDLGAEDLESSRREELLKDVEQNVSMLQGSFGLKRSKSEIIHCDNKILSRTMTLPKGRMLLSRVIDEGILPHPSACTVLPNAIRVVLESASTADLSSAPPAGEDRLLRSLTGLVKTVQPSVDAANLLACLRSAIEAEAIIHEKKRTMKAVLTMKRTLMELLHSIFTRGGEVCATHQQWKEDERKFLAILSGN